MALTWQHACSYMFSNPGKIVMEMKSKNWFRTHRADGPQIFQPVQERDFDDDTNWVGLTPDFMKQNGLCYENLCAGEYETFTPALSSAISALVNQLPADLREPFGLLLVELVKFITGETEKNFATKGELENVASVCSRAMIWLSEEEQKNIAAEMKSPFGVSAENQIKAGDDHKTELVMVDIEKKAEEEVEHCKEEPAKLGTSLEIDEDDPF